MIRRLLLILLLGAVLPVAACSTVAGVGEDISGTARWTKRQLDGR